MEIYSIDFEKIYEAAKDILFYLSLDYEQSIILYSLLLSLIVIFSINRRVSKIERVQFNDIDDVTSFNRLVDDELGILKKRQDELSQGINIPDKNIDETSNNKLFDNAPYTQAVQLARRGYAREDIISLCSLTESEVELILALHSNPKAA